MGSGAIAALGLPPRGLMTNNDVLRRLRYALYLSDGAMLELMTLGGRPTTPPALAAMFRRDEDPEQVPCEDLVLLALLDGLIVKHRGPKEGGAAPTLVLDNNLILQKLRSLLVVRRTSPSFPV